MRKLFAKIPWRDVLLVAGLILFDLAIHPLTGGPDRLVHDPAVYRLGDPNYLPGDWYTGMAVKSGIYLFYAKLVNAYQFLHLPEELWRQLLYLAGLAILFYSLIRIARLFTKSIFVVPIIALFHAFLITGLNQPVWLYGPFIQVDGGLAPRPIGVTLSFLALLFLLQDALLIASVILGLATLIHPSNSLIVFTLFLIAWLLKTWVLHKEAVRQRILTISRQAGLAILIYLIAGGWFAVWLATKSTGSLPVDFPTEKFIWVWTYFRAPYLALSEISWAWWLRFFAHIAAGAGGWLLLRKMIEGKSRQALDILGIVGLGSVVYFFLYYLFAFVWPWLPGFQFYSIRVVYFAYFVTYLIVGLLLLIIAGRLFGNGINSWRQKLAGAIMAIALLTIVFGPPSGPARNLEIVKNAPQNLRVSWQKIVGHSQTPSVDGANNTPPRQILLGNFEPFLAPPDWNKSRQYLPQVISFKSFGFTVEGLPEWFRRLNDVSRGELEKIYMVQQVSSQWKPVEIHWREVYSGLTDQEILALATKYRFRLFLTYRDLDYPFRLVAEDEDHRLYEVSQ